MRIGRRSQELPSWTGVVSVIKVTRGDGLGGGTASSQGEERGGRRKTSGKGRHLGEKVNEKRLRSPRAQPDDGESDDGEEYGKRSSRDKEGEDTEDMRECKRLFAGIVSAGIIGRATFLAGSAARCCGFCFRIVIMLCFVL